VDACERVRIAFQNYLPSFDANRERCQRLPDAGTCDATAVRDIEHRPMRVAQNERFVGSEKFVRPQIQRVTGVRAPIHVRGYFIAPAHEEAVQRPIARADSEGARTGIAQFVNTADDGARSLIHCIFGLSRDVDVAAVPTEASISPARIINQNSTMPGSAMSVVSR